MPINDFFDKYVTPGQFDFTVFSWIGTPFPISSSRSIYAKPTSDAEGRSWTSSRTTRASARTRSTAVRRRRCRNSTRRRPSRSPTSIDALIWQEVHSLTLYQRPEIFAVKKGLANFGAFGFADRGYPDIGWVAER